MPFQCDGLELLLVEDFVEVHNLYCHTKKDKRNTKNTVEGFIEASQELTC